MREDMFKVIVERPRLVNSNAYSRDGRRYRNQEDTPLMLGMKRGYGRTKWLNENLAPLERFLAGQVNRPWNKVYGEICATIDGRSTVKQHILQHIEDFVALDAQVVDGEIFLLERWGKTYVPLHESRRKLFVDPRTGILRSNRHQQSWSVRKRAERAKAQQEKLAMRRIISDRVQLHRIDAIWYQVEIALLPEAREIACRKEGQWVTKRVYDKCFDVVRKEWVSRELGQFAGPGGKPSNCDLYGNPYAYAKNKRQLNSRELRKFGLA